MGREIQTPGAGGHGLSGSRERVAQQECTRLRVANALYRWRLEAPKRTGMCAAPSALILDDGELDRVEQVLRRLGAELLRLKGDKIGRSVPQPQDLLITSGRRALKMPLRNANKGEKSDPIWICIHSQDFLPLRRRLRELGVHYLVQSTLDAESLRLLLLQVLYRGAERRQNPRLPLGGDLSYRHAGSGQKAKLADLSLSSCRILGEEDLLAGTDLSLVLPPALTGDSKVELRGTVIRSIKAEPLRGIPRYSVAIRFQELEAEASKQLQAMMSGDHVGTRVTPLAVRHGQPPVTAPSASTATHASIAESSAAEESGNQPRQPRREYRRQVLSFGASSEEAPQVALGCDLSLSGVRIMDHPSIPLGREVRLALYGASREEPVILNATVVRHDAEKGMAFQFAALSPSQLTQLRKLSGGLPALESLAEASDTPLVVSRVMTDDE
jgi:hypothetical protein